MKKLFTYLLLFLVADLFGYGTLTGHIYDTDTQQPIIIGTVALYQNGVLVTGTDTDFEGDYSFGHLETGEYKIEVSYVGYHSSVVDCVIVEEDQQTILNIPMSDGGVFELFVLCCFTVKECQIVEKNGPMNTSRPTGPIILNDWEYKVGRNRIKSCNHLSEIKGVVRLLSSEDNGEKEPALFATVALYDGEKLEAVTETDLEGAYVFENLEKGDYTIKVNYLGYQQGTIEDINLITSKYEVSLDLEPEVNSFPEVVIIEYKFPLISGCGSTCVGTTFCGAGAVETYPAIKEVESDVKIDEPKIKIFPNPAHSILSVDNSAHYDHLNLYSIHGLRAIENKPLTQGLNRLDVSALTSGQYVLMFFKEGVLVETEMVQIVQN